MTVTNTKTNERHEVRKYIKSEGVESVWCDTWYGRHIIGDDCVFTENAGVKAIDLIRFAEEYNGKKIQCHHEWNTLLSGEYKCMKCGAKE